MAKIKVSELQPGDKIRTSSQGVFSIVSLIRVFELPNRRTMYNFKTDSAGKRFCARGGATVTVPNR